MVVVAAVPVLVIPVVLVPLAVDSVVALSFAVFLFSVMLLVVPVHFTGGAVGPPGGFARCRGVAAAVVMVASVLVAGLRGAIRIGETGKGPEHDGEQEQGNQKASHLFPLTASVDPRNVRSMEYMV